MKQLPWYFVKKQTLLAVAGTVWLLAGVQVARLGLLDYGNLPGITPLQIVLSLLVFGVFGMMFYKMAGKHSQRMIGYEQPKRPIWNFFDVKAYCMMALMMSGGCGLRASGLVPTVFIAVFYTGLGCALAAAGIIFWQNFLGCQKASKAE